MGLFDIFFGKRGVEIKEEARKEATKIDIHDVRKFFLETKGAEIEAAKGKLLDMQKEILEYARGLPEAAGKISSKPGTLPAAEMIKESLMKQIRGNFSSLPEPNAETLADIESFHKTISQKLGASMTHKQAYVISNYYSEESEAFMEKIKAMQQRLEKYRKFGEDSAILHAAEGIRKVMERYTAFELKLRDSDSNAGWMKKETEKLQLDLEKIGKGMEELGRHEGWKRIKALEESLDMLRGDEDREIVNARSRVSERRKRMKGLWHHLDSGRLISKEFSAVFRKMIEEPGEIREIVPILERLEGIKQDIVPREDIMNLREKVRKHENKIKEIAFEKEKMQKELSMLMWLKGKKETLESEAASVRKQMEEKGREISLEANKRAVVLEEMGKVKAEMKRILAEKAGIQADVV
ncbi:MAG: hypothetical protein HYX24_06140 [Candidatus Aenigmarchaeota archaeon]|nr:hypothetical protein [Candidatus Aenigmarchaeota archaeon]